MTFQTCFEQFSTATCEFGRFCAWKWCVHHGKTVGSGTSAARTRMQPGYGDVNNQTTVRKIQGWRRKMREEKGGISLEGNLQLLRQWLGFEALATLNFLGTKFRTEQKMERGS